MQGQTPFRHVGGLAQSTLDFITHPHFQESYDYFSFFLFVTPCFHSAILSKACWAFKTVETFLGQAMRATLHCDSCEGYGGPAQNSDWTEDSGEQLYCAEPHVINEGLPTVHMFPNRPRNGTFFFAGTTGMVAPAYSHGVRQADFAMFHNRSEIPGSACTSCFLGPISLF